MATSSSIIESECEQWIPEATVSCICTCELYVCAALEYANCIVLHVWRAGGRNTNHQSTSNNNYDNDEVGSTTMVRHGLQELKGHKDRVECAAFSSTITIPNVKKTTVLCTTSSDA